MPFLLVLFALLSTNPDPITPPAKVHLTIDVHNVQLRKGIVFVAVFTPGKAFPEGEPMEGKRVDATSGSVKTVFSVEPGEYAVAVYHDENGNGKMDKRMFGIPKEPYGFSNDFRPTMSAPKFKDCQFKVGSEGKTISVKLK